MSSRESRLASSDAELIEGARSGDTRAFAELWQRHSRSAARVARQCTSSIDADDLVSEAYARILQRVLAGGGPVGAFRPYLYTTIRNLAATWGAQQSRSVQLDLIEDLEDERIPDDPAAWALDRTLTAQAFRSLPERWQTVLWYTQVEGMDPHEVAPLMGMTANGVAALSYRAREGLRTAWLQAHINDAQASGECRFVMGKLGEHSRDGLGGRDRKRVEAHLAECDRCVIVSEEVEEIGSHLSLAVVPLLLGGVIGGGVLAAMTPPGAAMASATAATPAVAGGLTFGAATGTAALAVAVVLGGGIAIGVSGQGSAPTAIAPPTAAQRIDPQQAQDLLDIASPVTVTPREGSLLAPVAGTTGSAAGGPGGTLSQLVGTVDDVVGDVDRPAGVVLGAAPVEVTPTQATVSLDLSGIGTPGATVSAQLAGAVHTTVVGHDGHWALHLSGLPQDTSSAALSQSLVGLTSGPSGPLGIQPLTLDTAPGGVSVTLLGTG